MITLATWKEVIADQALEPGPGPDAVEREALPIHPLPGKAVIITGPRRAGKSTYLKQWLAAHRKGTEILSLNFVDERLDRVQGSDLTGMLDAFFELQASSPKATRILCLDEVQRVPGWELFIERQLRLRQLEVFLTGSSARMLSSDIATEMRGRSLPYELFPFSFREFLRARHVPEAGESSPQRAKIRRAWQDYLKTGGFPEVVLAPASQRKPILQNYFETWVTRDLAEKLELPSIPLARAFLKMLLLQFGAPMTLNRMIEKLRAQGYKLAKETAANLLAAVSDAYVGFTIPILSESVQQQNTRPKKVYAIDVALPAAITVSRNHEEGRKLENLVFLELRRRGHEIRYFLTKAGHEVDFVLDARLPIQCCFTLSDEETRVRELRAMEETMVELGSKQGLILTHEERESIQIKGVGRIEIVPAWEWALQRRQ